MDDQKAELDLLIAKFEAMAQDAVERNQRESFIIFLRHYFETTALSDLLKREADALFATILGHWNLAQQRGPNAACVRIVKIDRAQRDLWAADVVYDDMPFLVDSISMSVRRAGGVIENLVHPVMAVERNTDGAMRSVSPLQTSDANPESFVHIECSGLTAEQAESLASEIAEVLNELKVVVQDWRPMMDKVDSISASLNEVAEGCSEQENQEIQEFLTWLKDDHFTFLGYRESLVESGTDGNDRLVMVSESNLGLLKEELPGCDPEGFVAPAAELDKYAQSARLMVVTKGNQRSRIHHPEYLDVVTIKVLGDQRKVISTHRFIGLFSAEAYLASPHRVPVLRLKCEQIIKKSALRENSHAAKNLVDILEKYPRDELVQSSEEELFSTAMAILALCENISLRLFVRRDRYGRFYSCLVYLSKERFSRQNRERIVQTLKEELQGHEVEASVDFPKTGTELVRIHCIVHTQPGTHSSLDSETLQQRLIEVTRTWKDKLAEALCRIDADADELINEFGRAFPIAYRDGTEAVEGAADLEYLHRLSEEQPLLLRLMAAEQPSELAANESDSGVARMRLKLYLWRESVPLSEVLPVLENFGLSVLTQHPYEISAQSGQYWIQEYDLTHPTAGSLSPDILRQLFEDAFPRTWDGRVENDGFNRLVLAAQLGWRQVVLLRLISKYLMQMNFPFSQSYMERILADNADITRDLTRLFVARFDPQLSDEERKNRQLELVQSLSHALDEVTSLDADRVLRGLLSVIRAGLRTNFYQPTESGEAKAYISLKVDPTKIPEMPLPKPMFETFVYAPWVEGVHLRGGKVARGGLRWSDRQEDFRTEVLGLVKAQMVKNAVIVPVGAKGGFVVKKGPSPAERKAWLENGIECYKTFIRGLLDITDNLTADAVVPPVDVVRHDEDDPYLVVAADKGTATFSDIANGLSEDYGFWLGDAFASGGSAGYDHKKMGITAKGAWESVKRHFRELGVNCQEEEFTVVGIGDMGGDVFGNGMLLSKHIRLVAAFNHLHIFIDPKPDAASSYAERQRLFEEVAGWDQYDSSKISKGGAIYSRKDKSIELSAEARQALGIEETTLAPNELLNRILKAPVDLLWNGGIGTYVKAAAESHLDVGDRANDSLRVDGRELRCKIVGEGGNLGLTQLGRIEFALQGGRVNSDAIDNSGGVDSSDREVNIKIPLNELIRDDALVRSDRDELLVAMTDQVSEKVLEDNYAQSQAISLLESASTARLDEHANLMRMLERDGLLNRVIEYLPDEDALNDRRNSGQGLTRPELAVLLSYAKISLFDSLLDSQLPDDELLAETLLDYFPDQLQQQHREALLSHRLRREIIATVVTNNAVNRMGMAYIHRAAGEVGAERQRVVKAYLVAAKVFAAEDKWQQIEILDNQVSSEAQYALLGRIKQLLKHTVGWLLAHAELSNELSVLVARYSEGVSRLEDELKQWLVGPYAKEWHALGSRMEKMGAPPELASKLANSLFLTSAFDMIELAEAADVDLEVAARCYFHVGDQLQVPWLLDSIIDLNVDGKWQALARGNLRDDTYWLHRRVTQQVLGFDGESVEERFAAWQSANTESVEFGMQRIAELQSSGVTDFLSLAVAVRELRKLMRLPTD